MGWLPRGVQHVIGQLMSRFMPQDLPDFVPRMVFDQLSTQADFPSSRGPLSQSAGHVRQTKRWFLQAVAITGLQMEAREEELLAMVRRKPL